MTHSWPTSSLSDLVEGGDISYGIVQPGNHVNDGVPIVRVRDIRKGRVDMSDPLRVSSEISERYRRTRLRGGEVLVSIVGTVGETAVAPDALAGWNVARAVAVLRPTTVSPHWIRLCFETASVRAELTGTLNTTVQATLNLSDLKRLRVPVPPPGVRHAITEVLGAFDNKIAANDRILQLQDELIRSSFGQLGGEERTLSSVAAMVKQQLQPTELPDGTTYLGLEHLPRRQMWAREAGTAAEVTSAKSLFAQNDVLFGKLRPYFHKVVSAGGSGVCSTDILVVRALDPRLAGFVLAACASDETVRACVASSDGTRMPRTSWKDLSAVTIPWPGEDRAREFSSRVLAKSDLAHALIDGSRRLAAMRDELLPLLMSGRIRVRDAEKVVEEVV